MYWLFFILGQCLTFNEQASEVVYQRDLLDSSDTIEYTILNSYDELEAIISERQNNETLIVNFWATWCAPCVKELPYFESFYKTNKSKNIRLLLISLDFPNHIEKRYVPFIEKHQLAAELYILNDPNENEWIGRVDKEWSGTIPATLFIKDEVRIFTDQEMHSVNEISTFVKQL